MECSQCGGPLALLGGLGRWTWFRCINCGLDQSVKLTDEQRANMRLDDDDETEDSTND